MFKHKHFVKSSFYPIFSYYQDKKYLRCYIKDKKDELYMSIPENSITSISGIFLSTVRTPSSIYLNIEMHIALNDIESIQLIKFHSNPPDNINENNNNTEKLRKVFNTYPREYTSFNVIKVKDLWACIAYKNIKHKYSPIIIEEDLEYPMCIQFIKSINDFIHPCQLIFRSYENLINCLYGHPTN